MGFIVRPGFELLFISFYAAHDEILRRNATMPVEFIAAPPVQLDNPTDRQQPANTVEQLHPRRLILDPLSRRFPYPPYRSPG